VAGICDKDGSALMEREDDREEVIVERLRAYQELTGPILQFYGESVVRRIDGSAPTDRVKRAIESAISAGKKRAVLLPA
jgi:adenylate kinase